MDKIITLKKRLDKLKTDKFLLSMENGWTEKDFELSAKLSSEINKVQDEIKKLEEGV